MVSFGGVDTDPFELKRMMRQEAHEKAFEIQVMSQRLYEKEKDKIVQAGLLSKNEDFQKKLQKLTQDLNIARSKSVNETRLEKMKARNECIDKIRGETRDKLIAQFVNASNSTYRKCIKNLIIQVRINPLKISLSQGMIKLLEKELLLKCKRDDLQLIRELIPECEHEFEEIMAREVNQNEGDEVKVEYKTKLILVDTEFLNADASGKCGGVVLTSLDKRIVCDNTLESRLNLCFEELLPQIRKTLFPQPEKVKKEEKPKAGGHGHKH